MQRRRANERQSNLRGEKKQWIEVVQLTAHADARYQFQNATNTSTRCLFTPPECYLEKWLCKAWIYTISLHFSAGEMINVIQIKEIILYDCVRVSHIIDIDSGYFWWKHILANNVLAGRRTEWQEQLLDCAAWTGMTQSCLYYFTHSAGPCC